jgi:hypothetical protein
VALRRPRLGLIYGACQAAVESILEPLISKSSFEGHLWCPLKNRLGDQREGEIIGADKILLKELDLCPNSNSKSHTRTPIAKTM